MKETRAYYNENNKFKAFWLRHLIAEGLIAKGEVDERSIKEVTAKDLKGFTQCHFFAGIGVWSYALRLAGWPDEKGCWTGSCPCQPFSVAGERRRASDERHLWPYWKTLIFELRPLTIFGEQVASDDGLAWLDVLYNDLENENYTVGAVDLCAAGFGAPQVRQRLYFVAHAAGEGLQRFVNNDGIPGEQGAPRAERGYSAVESWRQLAASPTSLPSVNGIALGLARNIMHGYGDAIVAQQAAAFIRAAIAP